jgi:hypothetical protein
MPSKPAAGVTVGEPDVGIDAGRALVIVVVSSSSGRYPDSAKSLPLTSAERRRTESISMRIASGIKGCGVGTRSWFSVYGRWIWKHRNPRLGAQPADEQRFQRQAAR